MESPEELTQSDQALMTQKLACGTARSLLINFQQQGGIDPGLVEIDAKM